MVLHDHNGQMKEEKEIHDNVIMVKGNTSSEIYNDCRVADI